MSINVFLADDHAIVRDGLKCLLESQQDINVIGTAENGRDAVRQVLKAKPDVVIMDISMPELNGIDAARQIVEQSPNTKIVMLSMHSASEHVSRALRSGASGYLLKETAGTEVIDAVRSVHKGLRYLSQKISDSIITKYIEKEEGTSGLNPLSKLSPREIEILQLVAEGRSSADIAKNIFLSPKTVETYRSRIMQKLKIDDIPGLVKFAIKYGLTTLE